MLYDDGMCPCSFSVSVALRCAESWLSRIHKDCVLLLNWLHMEFHLLFKKLRSLDLAWLYFGYLAMNKTALGELDEIFYLLFMRRLKDDTYILDLFHPIK